MTDDSVSPPPTEEDLRMAKYWSALATMLGYNELTKLGRTLGEKAYFRLFREDWKKIFIELGGNDDVFAKEDAAVSISVPYGNMPHIVFVERDVELMRDYVYKYDKERSTQ